MKKILYFTSIILLLTSCSSVNRSVPSAGLQVSVKSELEAKVRVNMNRKITGFASAVYLFHLFKIGGDTKYVDSVDFNASSGGLGKFFDLTEKVKGAAIYNAISKHSVDVLVSPQYVITSSNWNPFYRHIKVKVTGYPGTITRIQ